MDEVSYWREREEEEEREREEEERKEDRGEDGGAIVLRVRCRCAAVLPLRVCVSVRGLRCRKRGGAPVCDCASGGGVLRLRCRLMWLLARCGLLSEPHSYYG